VVAEPVQWLSDTEQHLWRRLLGVERRLQERLDQELREAHNLSLGDYAVLVHLSEAPHQELRMSELADEIVLSRSGLTRRVDGLVKEGLVTRRACPADKRGSYAQLTPAGVDLLRIAAPTHVSGVRRYLIDAIGSLSLASLADGLCRIENALGRASAPADEFGSRSVWLGAGDKGSAPLDPGGRATCD
jgi:DNA-binding MarR family transcriptional regulator